MLKKQVILTVCGIAAVLLLFFLGSTVGPKTKSAAPPAMAAKQFDIQQFIAQEKSHLSPQQVAYLNKLENSVTRGDVKNQLVTANLQLAGFWKDSVHVFEPYFYYLMQATKLDKSEKNLTFAGQLILDNLRGETDEAKLNWKTGQAIALYEEATALYPDNDDFKVGLGSSYIFGKGRVGGAAETMKGIQELLSVVRKDSTNMKAQMMLGVGGYVSGQYDKAIERLQRVVKAQPDNLEAVAFLADAYAASGNKAQAITWYQVVKRMVNDPAYIKEVDERIKALR